MKIRPLRVTRPSLETKPKKVRVSSVRFLRTRVRRLAASAAWEWCVMTSTLWRVTSTSSWTRQVRTLLLSLAGTFSHLRDWTTLRISWLNSSLKLTGSSDLLINLKLAKMFHPVTVLKLIIKLLLRVKIWLIRQLEKIRTRPSRTRQPKIRVLVSAKRPPCQRAKQMRLQLQEVPQEELRIKKPLDSRFWKISWTKLPLRASR